MLLSANGVSPFEIKVNDYEVDQNLAVRWYDMSNGNKNAIDRGMNSDTYQCTVTTFGTENYINAILTAFDVAIESDGKLQAWDFAENEQLFGENIDHSSIECSVIDIKTREANSFKGFKLTFALKNLSPSFNAGDPFEPFDFSDKCIQYKYKGYRSYNIKYLESEYQSIYENYFEQGDSGIFEGIFTLTNQELIDLLEYYRLNRINATVSLSSLYGVSYPFGPSTDYGLTANAQIIRINHLRKWGISSWLVKVHLQIIHTVS